MHCANCGDDIATHGSSLCDYCLDHRVEQPEEQEEDYEGEARLQRWERAREEWWA